MRGHSYNSVVKDCNFWVCLGGTRTLCLVFLRFALQQKATLLERPMGQELRLVFGQHPVRSGGRQSDSLQRPEWGQQARDSAWKQILPQESLEVTAGPAGTLTAVLASGPS